MSLKATNNVETNKYELEIEISAEKFEEGIQKAYQRDKNKIQISGFRKGKAPRKLIEREYGAEVFFETAVNILYPEEVDNAVKESGLDKLIKASYSLLGLISYLTSGEDETRAWTITKGTKAPQAAGKIHTDFERGFIKAEVVAYDDLMSSGSMLAAKEKGLVRQEGKDYVVQDGDVILFKFNV